MRQLDEGAERFRSLPAYDEGMHGSAHDAFVELRQQDERVKPAEAPDLPWPQFPAHGMHRPGR